MNQIQNNINRTVFLLCLMTLGLSTSLSGQIRTELNDGPYIFQVDDSLHIQWIEAGIRHDTMIACEEAGLFNISNLPEIDLRDLDFKVNDKSYYTSGEKVVALSDVHGQYDLMIKLLKANNVIDEDLKWSLGKGHLVVVGDNMDRGDKVLDILWFLFKLEKQADKAGGKVNVLLGNHEIMVLNGDLRYLNKKYYYTSAVFKTRYDQFFKEGSILGDWITSQQVVIAIDKTLFLHGGISPQLLELKLSLNQINKVFSNDLARKSIEEITENEKKSTLFFEEGPLWYRGYFNEDIMPVDELNVTFKKLKVNKIVVGHTSLDAITSLYDGRVIAIDCSIKLGLDAQLLIIDNGLPYVGDLAGNRRLLESNQGGEQNSLLGYIRDLDTRPNIEIVTEVKALVNNDSVEVYQPASFTLKSDADRALVEIQGEIRTRGRSRKTYCYFPPLKINISKSTLNSMGFLGLDKLKCVLPCTMDSSAHERLLKEFLLYDIYQSLIDNQALQTTLVNFQLKDSVGAKYGIELPGFLVEDDTELIYNRGGKIIEMGMLDAMDFERNSFVRMCFFQYMIANTDWTIENRNNILAIQLSEDELYRTIPYDFDFAGFVDSDYAKPDATLPIKDIHERYFMSYPIDKSEFEDVVAFYLSIEEAVYEKCRQATYLTQNSRQEAELYLKGYFDELRAPEALKTSIIK